ncbi:gamma-glutamyl-gamma-aminobutyrate hydrolase family protein [Ketogulonicigenium vulgare]|uniref:gamma-glutamyl-gamma-aminobutyrate hydrolase n=1 Tax=Ketogulonicigenium vulgare (strain WSH-001) TaxID=759362 RepID=F9Y7B4_KETVW|nr:gamma-glutamyl-gamma-aminobutyrate hydrolase family protein [Ketogulonicigenium vulgare]ADO42855.1 Gamma-glutamyl-gamma-aminobutyrate hydrolase [Ketogulonicigenium vulgare Y25]AEM41042.1 Glutamine amidotransferase, putative [Ketogulonicigenium vulgare WSH-001]ALJ81189.1 glutamine amidotransferase [Ketogulonicigenium vulgare]ANW33932.1 gamma-glutamyl-gamma-aminobutyrate hydrolase [Ketogulonicigenium vulgare]AOZ54768.1 gamma-glutamyl-gamma-aminobutyrate hydrolase [Ketogulonicigenium vulgare]
MSRQPRRPVIGIIANNHVLNERFPVMAAGQMEALAVAQIIGGIPLLVPPNPAMITVEDLLDTFDGFILTGGRPNVHPEEYGEEPTDAHGDFDRNRDAVVLPLIRACVQRGQPFLGICRGFQEVNVAMGGSLYPEIRDLPGRMNHRMPPEGTLEERYALRHRVTLAKGGRFADVFGAEEVMTNTLHGQGIKTPGPRVRVDGLADDGTPEAIYVADAPGFTMSVQWHPEWRAAQDPVSHALFSAFGAATKDWVQNTGAVAIPA